jgi:hypothetical protein
MEVIYTGREKNLHYILAKRIIKDRKIRKYIRNNENK